MDATDTRAAILVGLCSDGVWPAIQLAASDPERVLGIVAFGPGIPQLTPPSPERAVAIEVFQQELESYEGWFKYNSHYIEKNFSGFMEFFFGEMYPEPHSTKQIEDTVAYALDGRLETFMMDQSEPVADSVEEIAAVCAQVRCPVLVVQGTRDNCQPFERGVRTAELTGAPREGPIDLRAIVRGRLLAAGVGEVRDVEACTICDERFFSHRREGEHAGRQAGVAWLS